MIVAASSEKNEFKRHGTSPNPTATIGRWRVDLDGPMKEAMTKAFAEVLLAFGYVTDR